MTNVMTKYQGQFGEFTIDDHDRHGVIVYRGGLMMAAVCFSMGAIATITQDLGFVLILLPWLYVGFSVSLGVALWHIHIYMKVLHQALQIFWAIGCGSAIICAAIAIQHQEPSALFIYQHPITILGIGFTFAALTGIFFKEAFCFNRLETKFLVAIAPTLLLGHLVGILSTQAETALLLLWALLFMIFAIRKVFQDIPSDIGDKSVFAYLENGELKI
jgi:uncharacterized integral membrane protein